MLTSISNLTLFTIQSYKQEESIYVIGEKARGKETTRKTNNIRMDLGEVGWGMWTGLVWLRIGTGGELL
jgi:hypothetical protein